VAGRFVRTDRREAIDESLTSAPRPRIRHVAASTFAWRTTGFIFGIALNVAISRFLGPTGRGEYALLTLAATTLATVGKLGLDHANVFMLGGLRAEPKRLAEQNALVAFVAGPIGAVLLLTTPWTLPSVFGDVPLPYLAIAGITGTLQVHIQLSGSLQNLRGLTTWQFRSVAYGFALQLALVAGLLLLGWLDVLSALVCNLVGVALTWAMVISRDGFGTLRPATERQLLLRTLRYALVVHIGLVLFFLQARLNQFIVKADLGSAALGLYSIASVIAEALLLASDSIAIALLPLQTESDVRSTARLALLGALAGAAITAVAAVPFVLLGEPLLRIVFGESFAPAYAPLVILLPGADMLAAQRFCGFAVLRANRPLLIMAIYLAGMVTSLVANLIWIPTMGLAGAALAITISYALTFALFLIWTLRLAGGRAAAR